MSTPQEQAQARIERTENYAAQVKKEWLSAVDDILSMKKRVQALERGRMYSFDGDSRQYARDVEGVLRSLHSTTLTTIKTGVQVEWGQANAEVDELLQTRLGRDVSSNPNLAGWFDRNEKAMDAFINRSDNGMNLSTRVWRNTRQLRDEMEVAITVSIGDGTSASTMSRKVRQYLNDPDLMFRRFRYKDINGQWQYKWKKRVRNDDGTYHFIDYDRDSYRTGAGVYKSSYRNAMRMTRTETNMAYRQADNTRWQGLDFVLGQHIELSRSHPEYDICDVLVGDYPKEFVFEGWHPQCFCICTAITAGVDEMRARLRAAMRGERYTPQAQQITAYPPAFIAYIQDNGGKLLSAYDRGKAPYFVAHNYGIVTNILQGGT